MHNHGKERGTDINNNDIHNDKDGHTIDSNCDTTGHDNNDNHAKKEHDNDQGNGDNKTEYKQLAIRNRRRRSSNITTRMFRAVMIIRRSN